MPSHLTSRWASARVGDEGGIVLLRLRLSMDHRSSDTRCRWRGHFGPLDSEVTAEGIEELLH